MVFAGCELWERAPAKLRPDHLIFPSRSHDHGFGIFVQSMSEYFTQIWIRGKGGGQVETERNAEDRNVQDGLLLPASSSDCLDDVTRED